ncbi:dipeptidase [Roseibacillus ishigakijimensis]|uniref:Dipeptidase n=1 Tax=Roseibacillus ishigakijimensis TaxID=454146 RepID=A0A934RNT7_9BACT|nr:dipeptidase [Roseibacillus ishigakijimensis]MBK1834233.1 dipeptidase [Roseibacillus ishigakijimensis]
MTPALEDLFAVLRFPSISTDSRHAPDVRACAQWYVDKFARMGLSVELCETARHPIVLARNERLEGRKTVLIYGHYDVQPVDPLELWDSQPFEPEIREGKIWARGSTDNKGQHMAHLLGIEELLQEEGELPVNLIFLLEGEEEIGSPNLPAFLRERKEELACDVIAVSDTGMVAPGVPTLGYGLRGIAACEVKIFGPDKDLHSGVYGGAVANPATAAARLIASLHHDDGTVAVADFYKEVEPLADWEREMWSRVPGMSREDILAVTGSPDLFGEAGYSSAERLWGRPTCEVNGVWGGYQGEGSKTVLPAEAGFKLTCRLVPDQEPTVITERVRAHLEAHLPAGVHMVFEAGHSGKAYVADPHSEAGQAAQEALREVFDREPVLIREGGSIPIIQGMKEILGTDTLMLGLALPDCQIHSPNENFTVENFEAGIRLAKVLLQKIGQR